jgi:choline dehydrogenase
MVTAIGLATELCSAAPMTRFIAGSVWSGRALSSRAGLTAAAREQVGSYQHPVGTCRMGSGAEAVVNCYGAVHGIERLHVVDASIMPTVPRANTNLPTLMVAERCAEWIRQRNGLSRKLGATRVGSTPEGSPELVESALLPASPTSPASKPTDHAGESP